MSPIRPTIPIFPRASRWGHLPLKATGRASADSESARDLMVEMFESVTPSAWVWHRCVLAAQLGIDETDIRAVPHRDGWHFWVRCVVEEGDSAQS